MSHQTDQELLAALARLSGLTEALHQDLTDRLWSNIPETISEYLPTNQGGAGTFNILPQTGGLELIEGICVVLPAAGSAVLQLGGGAGLGIPCGAGVTILTPVRIFLGPGDLRQLIVTAAASQVQAWLWGRQQPTYGALSK